MQYMDSGDTILGIGLLAVTLLMSVLICINAIYHNTRKTPINFWTGSVINPDEITDVSAYNRSNYLMWTVYLVCLALAGSVVFLNWIIGLIIYLVVVFLGVAIMIVVYKRIYNRYKTEQGRYRIEI